MREYVIWGKCKENGHEESVLVANAGSAERAKSAMKVLEEKHGCYDMRVQVLDLNGKIDFAKEVIEK